MQSFSGRYLYDSIEEKAANLLYFIIKNHPFFDGNKRSAAYSFIWFLNKAGVLDIDKINMKHYVTNVNDAIDREESSIKALQEAIDNAEVSDNEWW